MAEMTCWKKLLGDELDIWGETLEDVVSSTMSEEEMLVEFNAGYGRTHGIPFTVWTANRVYFPVCYDGAEWVSSASRNPDGVATNHIGAG
jgi:hypothetical protein